MLEFLIDNIFVILVDEFFNIPTNTNCAPFLADVFLYSHDADFIQGLLKKNILISRSAIYMMSFH
jgi:hypothetical protein